MQDKLEQVTQSAKVICENSNNPEEISLIKENVNTLTEQLNMIRAWIDEKKQQVHFNRILLFCPEIILLRK